MKKRAIFIIIIFCLLSQIYSETILKSNLYEPATLDPQNTWEITSLNYIYNIFDTLLKYDKKTYKLIPSLAIKWKTEKGGMEYILTLRKGVKFHDGTDFNADSVIFTFKRGLSKIKDKPRFPIFYELYNVIKSVEKAGDYKVIFKLKKPFITFLYSLANTQSAIISPKAAISHHEDFGLNPVGTGAFVFEKWEKHKKIVLSSNHNYWKERPKIDTFINIFPGNFGEDQYNPLYLFKNKKINFTNRYSISKMVSLKEIDWIKIKKIPLWGTQFFIFNFNRKPFNNIYFRKALNYLWNKKTLKYIFQDYVIPTDSLIPRGTPCYDESKIIKYPFSIRKAKKMLIKAGVKRGLTVEYITSSPLNTLSYDMILRYKKALKMGGINLKVLRLSVKEYSKRIFNGDFDIIDTGIIADYPEIYSFLAPLFLYDPKSIGMPNLKGYKESEEIYRMLKSASIETSDNKRNEIYKKINFIVSKKALIIPIMQVMDLLIYTDNIKGLTEDFVGVIDLSKVWKENEN